MSSSANPNSTQIPICSPNFGLIQEDNEFMIFDKNKDEVIYINDSTAIILELCNGKMNVGEIEQLLIDSYPNAASTIGEDLRNSLVMLVNHGVITYK